MSVNDLDKLIEEIIKEATNEFSVVDIFDREDDNTIKTDTKGNYQLISNKDFINTIKNYFGITTVPSELTKLKQYIIKKDKKDTFVKGTRALAAIDYDKWVLDHKDFKKAFKQKNTKAIAGEILMRTTNEKAYNDLVAIAKEVDPDIYTDTHLKDSVINIQKAAAKKAKQDVIDKMKKRNNEFVKSLQTATQQFPRHEPGSVMDPSKAQELPSLKASDDLNKASLKFVNLFLTSDFRTTPSYEEFKNSIQYLSSDIVVPLVRKLLDSEVDFSDEKKKKLLSLLKIANVINTSTFANLTTDREKDLILKRSFKQAEANLPPVEGISLEDPALKISKLQTDPDIKKSVFSKLSVDNLSISNQSKNTLATILTNVFTGFDLLEDDFMKENLLKEVTNVADLDAEDIFSLMRDPNTDKEAVKKALKKAYEFVKDDNRFDDAEKKEILDFISNLVRAADYYGSGRQFRTKRGATTGWKVGTAQASGTARIDKEVGDMMRKAGGGGSTSNIKEKLIEYSKFLDGVNRVLVKDDGKFDEGKSIETLVSQFVGLEILNDNLFQMEEASVKGNLFEAFLALICGGTQIGGELGGADYVYDIDVDGKKQQVLGSSKLINTTEFKQAKENLKEPMEYVIAIKYIKTKTGELKQAGKDDKIRFVKIFIVYSDLKPTPAGQAVPHIGKDFKNLTIAGKDVGTEVKFDMKSLMKSSYVCDFDFSFLEQTEFSDVSTKIMNKINAQVEKAFSSLTNLRDNITRWVSDKDVIAANQVESNQQDLTNAIEGMREEDELKTSELSESIQQLDKLILEILQESLDK